MGTLYAVVVGIDEYTPSGRAALRGCVNDVRAVRRWLHTMVEHVVEVKELTNGQATRDAMVAAIREHLGRAGRGDVALLWFSGHGTELPIGSPEHELIESTGRCQAIVCADEPLLDKELGALLAEVAAAGADTVAVLDCCFAGGATREDSAPNIRYSPPDPAWCARDVVAPLRTPDHLLLAASRIDQPAYENVFSGTTQGLFSWALLAALGAAAPGASYREVLFVANARVRAMTGHQEPCLEPTEPGGIADRPVFGDGVRRSPAPHLLRYIGGSGWEVDCGSAHGLPATAAGTEFTVLVADPADTGPVLRARHVYPRSTSVQAIDREPERDRAHPVTVSALPLAPCSVVLGHPDAVTAQAILAHPLLRLAEQGDEHHFRILRGRRGLASVLHRDGSPAVPPVPYERIVDCLAHLARWQALRDLDNPASALASHVDVQIWDRTGSRVLPDGTGEFVHEYTGTRPGDEPLVSIRIHNRSTDMLWCVLLDLTDSYAAHTTLYPGRFIGPGRYGHALDGAPVRLSLPPTRPVRPGASVRDWLKLIVVQGELNTVPFRLDAWDPDAPPGARSGTSATDGLLRLTSPRASRDLGIAGRSSPGDWSTKTLALRTVVPGRPCDVTSRGG